MAVAHLRGVGQRQAVARGRSRRGGPSGAARDGGPSSGMAVHPRGVAVGGSEGRGHGSSGGGAARAVGSSARRRMGGGSKRTDHCMNLKHWKLKFGKKNDFQEDVYDSPRILKLKMKSYR